MLFNSLQFLIYFPAVVMLYFALPHRFRWPLLLGASYYFYMCWKPEYVLLVMASTLVAYVTALGMGKARSIAGRKACLAVSLCINLGILFGFKYFNFFSESARAVLSHFSVARDLPLLNVALPIGISFYTFQVLSYTVDVFRGAREPERHLGIFAVYVAFFPQLVAGPIERSTHLLPQFREKHHFDPQRVADGLKLMLWGFFKKLVIADRLAMYVNEVYNHPATYHGAPIVLATYFFAFQIYCDFSGYSDIAIGAAQTMGHDLMDNFHRPYFARSVADFWKRWHISLSSWFRDYLYIPLGGSRVKPWRWHYNLAVVFVLSGLWHGANWTFVLWGAMHAFYYMFAAWTKRWREHIAALTGLSRRPAIHDFLKILVTYHLVAAGWLVFRANSLHDAWILVRNMFHFPAGHSIVLSEFGEIDLALALVSIVLMEFLQAVQGEGRMRHLLSAHPAWIRWAACYGLFFAIILFGIHDSVEFIYFQF